MTGAAHGASSVFGKGFPERIACRTGGAEVVAYTPGMPLTLDPDDRPSAEQLIKKSRFVARLRQVTDEQGAHELIAEARAQERGAGHHCYAYILDADSRTERSSDDGEPGGTAGAPMLAVLHARDLVNVAAVVSRHFGGVKLGTGGLVRAYAGTVSAALDSAVLIPRVRYERYRLEVDHADAGRMEADLRGRGFEVADVTYAQRAALTVVTDATDRLRAAVAALTAGSGELVHLGHTWR
jgi:uncharacterized YigZ family protein